MGGRWFYNATRRTLACPAWRLVTQGTDLTPAKHATLNHDRVYAALHAPRAPRLPLSYPSGAWRR